MKNHAFSRNNLVIILWTQIILISSLNAQLSKNGSPLSFNKFTKDLTQVPVITMPLFDIGELLREDSIRNSKGLKSLRFAKPFEVNIDIKSYGLMEIIKEIGTIWRLGIKSSGAYSINIIFSNFKLSSNAELFIYSSDRQSIIGAFTSENNQEFKSFATSPVKGDKVYVELFEPYSLEFQSQAVIGQVSHDYMNIFDFFSKVGGYGQSGICEVNINCPQGANWQTEKRSVCKLIMYGTDICTGELVNNTYFNGTPYILTAYHCYRDYPDKNAAANNTIFYFNYESPTCINEDVIPQSISGATLKSYWENSDFFLEQLTTQPPQNYNAYYSGWDRRNINSTSETGIHHPMGDIKKVSSSTNATISTALNSNTPDMSAKFWRVIWTSGITESGSSGSPLYNQDKKIVGQLAGGYSSCSIPSEPDWYGKFYSSWTGGGTSSTQLSYWLDPCSSGINTLNGNYCPPVSGDPYLSGPNPLCASESYKVNNQPNGTTIIWSCTSNISMTSPQGSNPCTFQKYSNGNGWIKAEIVRVCGNIILTKTIHTGPYSSSDYPISGPSSAGCRQYVYYSIPTLAGVTSINWTWPSGWTYVSGQNTTSLALRTGTSGGTIAVGVNNICGQSGSYATKYTSVYGCFSLIVSPIPASDNVNVSLIEVQNANEDTTGMPITGALNSTINPDVFNVTITDNSGVMYYTAAKKPNPFTLSVKNLREGNYIITVDNGTNKYSSQLIVKH